jgi:molybdenum cofactor guanylyltransferase
VTRTHPAAGALEFDATGRGVSGVILTGGRSTRMGQDKATARLAGSSLLGHVLDGFADVPVVIVGPRIPVGHPCATFVREVPEHSGPCAAIVAGAAAVDRPIVAVVATDLPFGVPIARDAAQRLGRAAEEADAVLPIDSEGVPQALCAAYRTHAVARFASGAESVVGLSVRSMIAAMRVETWLPEGAGDALRDLDRPEDLRAARARIATTSK